MTKLIQLLADNRGRGGGLKVEGATEEEATVYLYGAIGSWYGIEAQEFVRELKAIDAKVIHLRINSPGGDVFEARAMKTAIEQHKAKVIAHVDGLSASAASFLMMGAEEIEISDGAFVMIHNAWTIALGNAEELRGTAQLLDKVDGAIVADYRKRTGQAENKVKAWMAAETWFTADEAVAEGFADRVAEAADKADARAFNLAAYRNAPKALAPAERADPDPDAFDAAAADRGRYETRLALYEKRAA
jgi:ATP-dependent Clp protease, protease subunit